MRFEALNLLADSSRSHIQFAGGLLEAQVARGRLEGTYPVQRREAIKHSAG